MQVALRLRYRLLRRNVKWAGRPDVALLGLIRGIRGQRQFGARIVEVELSARPTFAEIMAAGRCSSWARAPADPDRGVFRPLHTVCPGARQLCSRRTAHGVQVAMWDITC
jgi:hypothetical protein